MDKIVIKGVLPYDGEYDLEYAFTNRELHTIKRLSGIRVAEMEDAAGALDSDLILALAVIVLERNGAKVVEDLLWDAKGGSIKWVEGKEDDALPPSQGQKQPEPPGLLDETATSSGDDSLTTSESPEDDPSRTGSLRSDTGVTLESETLAT